MAFAAAAIFYVILSGAPPLTAPAKWNDFVAISNIYGAAPYFPLLQVALIEIVPNRSQRGCPLYSQVRCTNEPAMSNLRKANTMPALNSATSGSLVTFHW